MFFCRFFLKSPFSEDGNRENSRFGIDVPFPQGESTAQLQGARYAITRPLTRLGSPWQFPPASAGSEGSFLAQ